jgi:thymidylate kinase
MISDSNTVNRRPLIVEIVGPAGAGKTTVLSALNRCDEHIHPIYGFRNKRYIPCYAHHAALLLPFIMRQAGAGIRYSPRELNRMIRLKAAHQILQNHTIKDGLVAVLDQGPVYTLTVLAGFGSDNTKHPVFRDWWEDTLKEGATTLDMVVWLDAPDEVLLERIQAREKQHRIKDKSRQEAVDFLARYRAVYQQVMAKMTRAAGTRVLRYDTSQYALDRIVADTLRSLNYAAGIGL